MQQKAALRIVHVCQPTTEGAATVVRDLARAGVAAGHDVTVVCPSAGSLPGWVVEVGARWISLAMSREPEGADLGVVMRLRRIAAVADVLHLHSSKAGALGRIAVVTMGRKRPQVIFSPHGWSWYVGGRAAGAYRCFERLATRVTDLTVTVSREEEADGRTVLGWRAHLRTIENGVDTNTFTPRGFTASRASTPLIVVVGRLSEQKGQDRAVRLLALLDRQFGVRLRLVGDGPDTSSLRELAVDLDVLDRVEFVGRTDPAPHLRAADIVLVPSRWEGMALAMLEAMSTECMVIATRCGGTAILNGAGYLVANTDAVGGEMLDAVRAALIPNQHNAELRAAARQAVVSTHCADDTSRKYLSVWAAREKDVSTLV